VLPLILCFFLGFFLKGVQSGWHELVRVPRILFAPESNLHFLTFRKLEPPELFLSLPLLVFHVDIGGEGSVVIRAESLKFLFFVVERLNHCP